MVMSQLPKQEESVIRPLTPYAVDKFASEKYVLNYCHLYDVPTSAVRFFNVYGPNQNLIRLILALFRL